MIEFKGSSGNYMTKIFLVMSFTMAMLFFSIIFSLHFMIEKESARECVEILGSETIYDYGKAINSRSMAERLVEIYMETNNREYKIRFIKGDLEHCGMTFNFLNKLDKSKYAVCENGEMYDYKIVCKD